MIQETIEVEDHPIASDLDAHARRMDLDSLQLHRRVLAEAAQGNSSGETRKRRRALARIDRAIELLAGQLAVWDTHDQ